MSPNSLFSSSRMKLKAGFVSCSLLLVVAMLLTACGSGGSPAANKTHKLVLAGISAPITSAGFNPYSANAVPDLGGFVYEPLFFAGEETGTWTGLLGTSHSFSPDGTQVTVNLRTGVEWNDGQPFSADDVVFTFNAMKQYPASDLWGVDSLLKSVTETDKSTVVFTFDKPAYVSFDTVGGSVFIIPKHIFDGQGDISKVTVDPTKSVGTGPMLVDSWSADLMTMKKNPKFYNASSIKVDVIKLPVYKANTDFQEAMNSNQADWASYFEQGLQKSYVDPDSAHHHYWMAPVDEVGVFMDIRDNKTLQDVSVRKALSLAIDRTAWAQQGEDGLVPASTQTGLLKTAGNKPYQLPEYANLSTSTQAAQAKQVLQQDGYTLDSNGYFAKNGQELSFHYITVAGWTDWNAASQADQQNLKAAGIKITIDSMQQADYMTLRTNAGKYDLMQSAVAGGAHSAYDIYYGTLASASKPPAGRNSSYWNDPQTDAFLSDLGSTNDATKMATDIEGLEKIMVNDVPWIPTIAGARWFEYSTMNFTGWPSESNPYATGATYQAPDNEIVLQHLTPTN